MRIFCFSTSMAKKRLVLYHSDVNLGKGWEGVTMNKSLPVEVTQAHVFVVVAALIEGVCIYNSTYALMTFCMYVHVQHSTIHSCWSRTPYRQLLAKCSSAEDATPKADATTPPSRFQPLHFGACFVFPQLPLGPHSSSLFSVQSSSYDSGRVALISKRSA